MHEFAHHASRQLCESDRQAPFHNGERIVEFRHSETRTMDGWPLALAGAAAVVLLVGMLACIGPALRGLRIRPIEALRT
jgi:hypothetical protein